MQIDTAECTLSCQVVAVRCPIPGVFQGCAFCSRKPMKHRHCLPFVEQSYAACFFFLGYIFLGVTLHRLLCVATVRSTPSLPHHLFSLLRFLVCVFTAPFLQQSR
jgi:hypothetical protein